MYIVIFSSDPSPDCIRTGITLIYIKNSSHFCLGVRSLQVTRSQLVAEVARVSQVQAMLELSQSTQTEAGAQAPAPVHWSEPPCSWALRGAWSNKCKLCKSSDNVTP